MILRAYVCFIGADAAMQNSLVGAFNIGTELSVVRTLPLDGRIGEVVSIIIRSP